jgi:Fe2+ transport system protein FeoA
MRAAIGNEIVCPSCGFRYDPASAGSCASCPLNSGCPETCCPACGYTSIDLGRSWVGRLVSRLGRRRAADWVVGEGERSLVDLPCGARAVISGLDGIPADSRERLQAYGLAPGRPLEIVHAAGGVTIVRAGEVELAFESDLARGIRVAGKEE